MSNQKLTRLAQDGLSCASQGQTTPFDQDGDLAKLFKQLSEGQMPNFLEMMSALSEISYEMTNDFGPCFDCKNG